ncbi:MAG: hypothetical protein ABEI77_03900, partial [Halorientalis sp.]
NLMIGVGVLLYFAALTLAAAVMAARAVDGAPTTGSVWEYIPLSSILGASAGAVIGTAVVFAVPDLLSTVIPLVALALVAVACVLAGNTVPIPGVDTALSTIGATIYAFVLPVAIARPVGGLALVLAAALGMPSLVAVRRWLQAAGSIDRRISVPLVVGLLVASGGAFVYDLSGPSPSVSLDTRSSVNLSTPTERYFAVSDHAEKRQMVRLGTVTARNDFAFARTASLPEYEACLYTGSSESPPATRTSAVVGDGGSTVSPAANPRLAGGETRDLPVVLLFDHVDGLSNETIRDLGTVQVRRAEECPASTDGPAIVLVPATDG